MGEWLKKIFPRRRLAVVVLFVEYDRGLAGGAERAFVTLRRYLSQVSGCRMSFVRIDNRNEGLATRRDGPVVTVGGDNRYREFSGWQRGVEAIARLKLPCEVLLLVNDMFLAPGESFLKDYARLELFETALRQGLVIGRIDSAGEGLAAYDYDLSRWVCSNCLLAPKAAVDRIGNLVTLGEEIDDFLPREFPGGPPFFKASAPINEAYRQWLVTWLTSRWHSRFTVDARTWETFRAKVRNILNESLLTARFAQAGFAAQSYGDKKYY